MADEPKQPDDIQGILSELDAILSGISEAPEITPRAGRSGGRPREARRAAESRRAAKPVEPPKPRRTAGVEPPKPAEPPEAG